jgi:acylphosphatase
MKSMRVVIEGRVQGVGFRAWTEYEALSRGLRGWVRNRRDGSVEAVFAGDEGAVDAMVAACRQGPRAANVTQLSAEPIADDGKPGFRALPTV